MRHLHRENNNRKRCAGVMVAFGLTSDSVSRLRKEQNTISNHRVL